MKLDHIPMTTIKSNGHYFGVTGLVCYAIGFEIKQEISRSLLPGDTPNFLTLT